MTGQCKLCEAKRVPIAVYGCCAGCNAIYSDVKIKEKLKQKAKKLDDK